MRKVIVTGGAGYIGSHTVVELHKAGFCPIIIDNLCNSSIKNLEGIERIIKKKIKWWNINCTDEEKIREVFKTEKDIHGVIHFAALKSVEESIISPLKYHNNNIGSLKVLMRIMEENDVSNIIFSSSCTVYGEPEKLPVTESTVFKKAESPYGETKQICEKMLEKSNFNSISLRYFNPIGCHPSCLIGDYSKTEPTNLVPIITEVAIGKRSSITIFGDDYDTLDGTCIRDYIHVTDLAKSHLKALEFLIKNPKKYSFNVGTGEGISVLELIQIFEQETHLKIDYKIGPRRKGDIAKIYADNKLILEHMNWNIEKSIKEAIIDAWNWEKNKS